MRLIDWIKSWFVKDTSRYDLFSPQQRNIYFYTTGKEGIRDVDPMEIEKRLGNVREDLINDIKVARAPNYDPKRKKIRYEAALDKIRLVFDVKAYKDGGLLEEELFYLLDHFINFTGTVKKNSPMPQTSVEDQSPNTPLPTKVEEAPPITNTLDSGSTVSESGTDKQEQSPMEQVLPSDSTPPTENTTMPSQMESPKQS